MKQLNFKIVMGCVLICTFCSYTREVSVTEKEFSSCQIVCGRKLTGGIVIASDKIRFIRAAYGYGMTPLVTVVLRNGETYVVAELWRPLYDVNKICNTLKTALEGKPVTLRIFPLWWALFVGIVLIGVGIADSFGLIRVVDCGNARLD